MMLAKFCGYALSLSRSTYQRISVRISETFCYIQYIWV